MLFPVFSLLRRFATSFVYSRTPEFKLDRIETIMKIEKDKFLFHKGRTVKLVELFYEGTPENSGVEISKAENKIWEDLKLQGKIYSIFIGPEEYVNGKRYSRIGVVLGVHRYN